MAIEAGLGQGRRRQHCGWGETTEVELRPAAVAAAVQTPGYLAGCG